MTPPAAGTLCWQNVTVRVVATKTEAIKHGAIICVTYCNYKSISGTGVEKPSGIVIRSPNPLQYWRFLELLILFASQLLSHILLWVYLSLRSNSFPMRLVSLLHLFCLVSFICLLLMIIICYLVLPAALKTWTFSDRNTDPGTQCEMGWSRNPCHLILVVTASVPCGHICNQNRLL